MVSMKNILPVTTVKKNLMKLLSQAQEDGSTFVITKDGKAAGVLMSAEEYEGMLETMEILSDPKAMESLRKAQKDIDEGRVYSFEEVFGKWR